MAEGLGMISEEWEALKSKVDDSFWVMRIIGPQSSFSLWGTDEYSVGYPPLPNDHDGFSCGAHKYSRMAAY
jgi:hypothetical protein